MSFRGPNIFLGGRRLVLRGSHFYSEGGSPLGNPCGEHWCTVCVQYKTWNHGVCCVVLVKWSTAVPICIVETIVIILVWYLDLLYGSLIRITIHRQSCSNNKLCYLNPLVLQYVNILRKVCTGPYLYQGMGLTIRVIVLGAGAGFKKKVGRGKMQMGLTKQTSPLGSNWVLLGKLGLN